MTRAIILPLDLLNTFLLFRFILGCEFRKTRSSVVIGASVIIASFAAQVFYFDALSYNVLWFFGHSICILPMIFLKGKKTHLLGLGIAYWQLSMPIISFADGIMLVVFKSDAFYANSDWYTIFAQVATTVIFCVLIRILAQKRAEINGVVMSVNVLIYISFSLILSIFPWEWAYLGAGDTDAAMLYQGANKAKDAITAMITIGFMIAIIYAFYQRKMLKREVILKERCIEEQVEQYRLLGSANEELRRFRHDLYKHLDTMTDLCDKGQMEKLGEYLHQIYQAKERLDYLHTGNMICDAVANRYYGKCRESGIRLHFSGFFPEDLSVAMTDLCVILSNGLDNAYEAVCKCTGEKEIKCKIGNQGGFLFITIWNPTETEPVIIGGHIQTTKKDQENHGFGTKNMQETAARNGGKVWWEYEKESKILVTHVQLRYHNMEKTGSN